MFFFFPRRVNKFIFTNLAICCCFFLSELFILKVNCWSLLNSLGENDTDQLVREALLFHFTASEADEDLGKGRLLFPLWKLLSLFSE